jgi:hypothetical protein
MTMTVMLAGSTFAKAPVDKPACATCLTVVVPLQAAEAIPDALDGLTVIVDLPMGDVQGAVWIIELIRRKGGQAGLLVPDSSESSDKLPSVDLLIVSMSHGRVDEQAVFELKKRLVTLRGELPAARLGVQFASRTSYETLARELAPYFDFAVSSVEVPSFHFPVVWRNGGEVTNAVAALDLTRGSTAQSVVVRPALDHLTGIVSDLVRARSVFASHLDVVAPRALSASEIVARHQAAVARQAVRIQSVISSGTLTVTFEAPGFPAPITVSAESIAYSAGSHAEIEMRSVRVNGIAFEGAGIPRLPIIEPERVSTPPLAIALTDAYRYELRGTADVEGNRCYIVDFEPLSRHGSFFKGRSWIDAETFGLVRVEARQTGLRGPIVASEQVDEYRRENGNLWLPSRSHVRQLYEGAAHKTPIDRVLVTTNHEIDPPDFERRRQAARTSSAVMLRDTPSGYRFLRQPTGDGIAASGRDVEAERDTGERASHIRTVVLGAMFDPNISYPLPFAGLSYVDFDLFGTGTQLNGFFGGSYGQLAISVPSLGGTRWQLGGRGFAILTSFNDRSFVDGRERYEANISQRPAHGSVWLVRPLTTRVSVKAAYELDYTRYRASDMTAQTFTVPADQVVHGFRASVEAQRGGWRASAYWNPALRVGWRPWGAADSGEYREAHHDFQRVGVSLVRVAVLSPALVVRGEGSWMAGRDLDRFSRMVFDAFENRLRGFPAALIRYDRGAVLRGSAAWSLGSRMRLDGFVDSAFVHDPGLGDGLTRLTGLGSALEVPAPFGMLFAVEWGYGIQGRRADGRQGTHVVRITGYKVF